MSTPEPEKSRWGLIIVGLAIAFGLVWFDWSNRNTGETSIVEPVGPRQASKAAPAAARRDFVSDLGERGLAAAINPVAAIPKTLLTDTINRPLFTATRRLPITPPPAAIPPPAPPAPPDPRVLQLVGVMVGKQGSVALVRMRGQQKSQPVRQGEIIAGWTIKEISPRSMKVRKAKVEATINVTSGSQTGGGIRRHGQGIPVPNNGQGFNPDSPALNRRRHLNHQPRHGNAPHFRARQPAENDGQQEQQDTPENQEPQQNGDMRPSEESRDLMNRSSER